MKTNTPKVSRSSIYKAVEAVLETGARSATVYQHPRLTVTASRRRRPDRRERILELVLTVGAPNFRNRARVKQMLEAGEPFPVKRVVLRFYPKR